MDTQGGDSEFQPSGWPSESESEDPGHDPDVLLREADELGAEPSAGLGGLEGPDRSGQQASGWNLHLPCCLEMVQGAVTTQRSLRAGKPLEVGVCLSCCITTRPAELRDPEGHGQQAVCWEVTPAPCVSSAAHVLSCCQGQRCCIAAVPLWQLSRGLP